MSLDICCGSSQTITYERVHELLHKNTNIKSLVIRKLNPNWTLKIRIAYRCFELNDGVSTVHYRINYDSVNNYVDTFENLIANTNIRNLTLSYHDVTYSYFIRLIRENATLTKIDIVDSEPWLSVCNYDCQFLMEAISHNTTLRSLNIPWGPADSTLGREIDRRCALNGWQCVLFDICLAFATLKLPPYVVLEIFDWLPYMDRVPHVQKIRTIQHLRRIFDALCR